MIKALILLGIIVAVFMTIVVISCCYIAGKADERMELERPDLIEFIKK